MLNAYIDSLKCLQKDNWDQLDLIGREKALQRIVDCYAKLIGLDSLCKVWVVKFDKNDDAVARYNRTTKHLEMREDLVVDGKMLMRGNKYRDVAHPSNHVFFYLMHEVKHAIQQRYVEEPTLCVNLLELKLTQCNQRHVDDDKNSYFSRISDRNDDMHAYAHCLYTLQPTERYAWVFAYEQLDFFVNKMHEVFPNDPAFTDKVLYSSFPENLHQAKELMLSFDPVRDIDNIVLTMGGEYVDERLNEFMCNVIKETQSRQMYDRIRFFQKQNEQILAERNFAEQQQMLDLDVSDLFQDESREIDPDNLDDLFQDISNGR